MRAFGQKKSFVWLVLVLLLGFGTAPRRVFADDDKDRSTPPAKTEAAKPAKAKIDTPAPGLTERERWLLDRV